MRRFCAVFALALSSAFPELTAAARYCSADLTAAAAPLSAWDSCESFAVRLTGGLARAVAGGGVPAPPGLSSGLSAARVAPQSANAPTIRPTPAAIIGQRRLFES